MKTAEEFCRFLEIENDITEDIVNLEKKVRERLGDKLLLLAKEAHKEGLGNAEFLELLHAAENYGEEIAEHKFRMQLVFAYYCFALLEEKYEKANLSVELYKATVTDFKMRIYECREVYHFNGIFVAWWYLIFCNMSLHGIGGLEFEKTNADFDYSKNGVEVKKGDSIVALHIPPKFKMNRESVTRAIKESYKFYGFSGRVAYQCDSWLLFPDYENVFVEGGNIKEFRSFFDVISHHYTETFEECWRVFKVGEIESLDLMPRDTRLQRNVIEHLKSGGKSGEGFGVLVFDGENIV